MFRSKTRIITAFVLCLIFIAYQAGINMFSHVHYVNGVMLVHSHPSKDKQHTHSKTSIVTLALIAEFSGVEPSECHLPQAVPVLVEAIFSSVAAGRPAGGFSQHIFLRGPPSPLFSVCGVAR